MNPIETNAIFIVKYCSVCQRMVEYYCHNCKQDLCSNCKDNHISDLNIVNHVVTMYREKYKHPSMREECARHLLSLMHSPVLRKCFTAEGIHDCQHISCISSDKILVSDEQMIILKEIRTNTSSSFVFDSFNTNRPELPGLGYHTVNSQSEVMYIDKDCNINKLSIDMNKISIFTKIEDSLWNPQCVFYSTLTGDLLVGMFRQFTNNYRCGLHINRSITINRGRVVRYDDTGKETKVIEHEYIDPIYITENSNGDVVVSDWRGAVVVSNREGRHRFSHTGYPSELGLIPFGICTDALLNILVCDGKTGAVHMLNQDGDFLSYLLTSESTGINGIPFSLSYDVRTHLLFVGSKMKNSVSVYRHINRVDTLHGILLISL